MKIGYGNYAIPKVEILDALPRLAEMGYEAVEICSDARWPTSPDKLSAGARAEIRVRYEELGLELPALMLFLRMVAPEDELAEQKRLLRETCALAHDLSPRTDRRPVIASTLGHIEGEWKERLPFIVERVRRFGAIAAEAGCRLAVEPHAGNILDRPQRVIELMEQTRSGSVGINFDNSHFEAGGYDLAETIRLMAPYALHTHVKDGRMEDGQVRFFLAGAAGTDYATYFREMAAAGWTGCVTVEVSAQIFNLATYDWEHAAWLSLKTLREAREAAFGGA